MPRSLTGARIRERRRSLGMTQAGLAAAIGISASYLNLIERNKRNIGGALLKRIASALGMAIDELDGAVGRRLLDDLGELAGEPRLAALRLDPSGIDDLAGRHPGWARALIVLQRALLDRDRAVVALSDRLRHDPFLGDAVHKVLSRVAAIRSSSEILETVEDLEVVQRQRFVSIIGAESAQLSDLAQALAAFFDEAHTATRSITPTGEVDDFLFDHDNHFPALEQAAIDFRAAAAIEGDCPESALADYLLRTHTVHTELRPAAEVEAIAAGRAAAFTADGRSLIVADTAAPASRRFAIAQAAVGLFRQGRPAAAEVDAAPRLTSDAARRQARRVLASYLAAAVLLPYDAFLEAAVRSRYDIDHLAQRFGASFEQVCHRLVTLRRPGAAGIPFGLMRSDAAGFTSKRFPLPRLAVPRHGPACPMWAIYQAFHVPGSTLRQLVEFPTGDRLLLVARAVEKPRPAFILPRRLLSLMLACDALHADQTVYGDGLDLSSSAPAVPVGPNCRLCVRRDCRYREEDPIIDA